MNEVEAAVRRLQAGDRLALTPLYHLYAQSAIRTAFLITGHRALAEDAVQESFVQVIRSISSLRDPAAFRPWFYRIVINAAKRLSRRRWLTPTPLAQMGTATAPSPEDDLVVAEEVEAVRLAIADLGDAHREILILRYYADLTEAEIAAALGVAGGTVKSRLHRAKEALQRRLRTRKGGWIK